MADQDLFADFRGNRKPSGKKARPDPAQLKDLVGAERAGDGIDPRLEARRKARQGRAAGLGRAHGEHKQAQLFVQVREAVDGALGAARNPILNALTAIDVTQNGGALAIVIQPRIPTETIDATAATQALETARSMLRREVAEAISRKDTPALQFVVLAAPPTHGENQ